MSKKNLLTRHASERFIERFGVEMSECAVKEIQRKVALGHPDVTVLRRSVEVIFTVEVPFNGRRAIVIFNATTGAFITAYKKRQKNPMHRRRAPKGRHNRRPTAGEIMSEMAE